MHSKRYLSLSKISNLVFSKRFGDRTLRCRLEHLEAQGYIKSTVFVWSKEYSINLTQLPKLSKPVGYIFASDFRLLGKKSITVGNFLTSMLLNRIKYNAFNGIENIELSTVLIDDYYGIKNNKTNYYAFIKSMIEQGYLSRLQHGKYKINTLLVKNTFQTQSTYFQQNISKSDFDIKVDRDSFLNRRAKSTESKQTLSIPLYRELINDCGSYELAIIYNQLKFAYKEELSLSEVRKLTLNYHSNQTLQGYLNRLFKLGFINKRNDTINGQMLYSIKIDLFDTNMKLLGLIEGKDIEEIPHYLTASILNRFRQYTLSENESVSISANRLNQSLGGIKSQSLIRNILRRLEDNGYIEGRLENNCYTYSINNQKLTNILDYEKFQKQAYDLVNVYKKYLELKSNTVAESSLNSFSKMFKRLLIEGHCFYSIRHIIAYHVKNIDLEPLSLQYLSRNFKQLKTTSFIEFSKRQGNRLIYRLLQDKIKLQDVAEPFSDNVLKVNDNECWSMAQEVIKMSSMALHKWYRHMTRGLGDTVEFEDFNNQALIEMYGIYNKQGKSETIAMDLHKLKYKLMKFYYLSRDRDNKDLISFIDDDFTELEEKINIKFNLEDKNTTNISEYTQELLSRLSDHDKEILEDYFGFDGIKYSMRGLSTKYKIPLASIHRIINRSIEELRRDTHPPETYYQK